MSILCDSFCTEKVVTLIHKFTVSGNGILGKLTKHFVCKSAAITICWHTVEPCYFEISLFEIPAILKSSWIPFVWPSLGANLVISKPHQFKLSFMSCWTWNRGCDCTWVLINSPHSRCCPALAPSPLIFFPNLSTHQQEPVEAQHCFSS